MITDFHDDYPVDRIADRFWASPKIWAMKKLRAPFIIFDADIVLHQPFSVYSDCDLLYLHRELSAPTRTRTTSSDLRGSSGIPDLLVSFRRTLPMNCATVGMFNESFKDDYVERYFEFVRLSLGIDVREEALPQPGSDGRLPNRRGAVAPGALAHKWPNIDHRPLRSRALVDALWASDHFTSPRPGPGARGHRRRAGEQVLPPLGAKKIQNKPTAPLYDFVRNALLEGRFIVEQSPQYEIVRDTYDRIIAGLTEDPTVGSGMVTGRRRSGSAPGAVCWPPRRPAPSATN